MSENLDSELRARQRSRTRSARRLMAALIAAVLILGASAGAVSSASAYRPVVVANGWSPSDVGTAAPLAASLGGSVLFASTDSLGDPTVDALKQLKPSEVVLVGGIKALSEEIEKELARVVPGVPVERLAGDDRIHTAALGALYTLGTATPEVSDAGAQSTASVGPGNAQDYRNGFVEARFRVGTDLLPGVWQASGGSAYSFRRDNACLYSEDAGTDTPNAIAVNDNRQSAFSLGHGAPPTRFGLLEGDIVTLRTRPGSICTIERYSE